MRKIVIGAIAALFALTLVACGNDSNNSEWPSSGIAEKIPTPNGGTIESVDYDDEHLDASVEKIQEGAWEEYIEACESKGFTIDVTESSTSYTAFSEEGYKLDLTLWQSSESMDISLDAPMEMEEITWPTMGAGALVPAPDSSTGKIQSDSSTFFFAYVGKTDAASFETYANACSDAGFSANYDKGDTWYYADNASGDHLSVRYEGFNTISIRVEVSDGAKSPEQPTQNATAPSVADSTTVSADFKATMDSYEAFFDEYVEFMKTYNENPSNAELMSQYADFLTQYTETMDAMNDIDTNSLSEADYAYYAEVQARITSKLLEATQ